VTVEINYDRNPVSGEVMFDSRGNPVMLPDPNANTFGQVYNRVLYETLGAATLNDARNAVLDAIESFEREQLWFNDMRYFGGMGNSPTDLMTKLGQEFYSYQDLPMLTNMPHIRQIMVLAFGNRYPLRLRTQQWIDLQSISMTWAGLPTDWCWVGNSIRIYPSPSAGYDLILEGTVRFPPLINDSDYNPWTNRGEQLIRAEAKRLLFRNINRDEPQAQLQELEIYGDPRTGRQGQLGLLRRETSRRQGGPGRLRASSGYL